MENIKEFEEMLLKIKNSKPSYVITVNKDYTVNIEELPSLGNEQIEWLENYIKTLKGPYPIKD